MLLWLVGVKYVSGFWGGVREMNVLANEGEINVEETKDIKGRNETLSNKRNYRVKFEI